MTLEQNITETNENRELALDFALRTDKNMFITGKAGTGKTTLLEEIRKYSEGPNGEKNIVVVAPTGIAAINAGGVTINSMFQLPFKIFTPNSNPIDPNLATNRYELNKSMRYKAEKRKLFYMMDVLVIDEISMVRPDVLDAIDYILKKMRGSKMPFGGVQVLAIGDLYQLDPVVKRNDASILRHYYKNFLFCSSHAWAKSNPITIELDKVYRQTDDKFINVLNKIRIGTAVDSDIAIINERWTADVGVEDKSIYLTTHNKIADSINQKELAKLEGYSQRFPAVITGEFPRDIYPNKEVVYFKVGARIMFIKNNQERTFFNGKLATIKRIDTYGINVVFDDDEELFVKKYLWENEIFETATKKDAAGNEKAGINKKSIGTFSQYPFKLAWAITVHKSQGLSFTNAVLDINDTFAPGQLYVALSRCRSLSGMQLVNKIDVSGMIVNSNVVSYFEKNKSYDDMKFLLDGYVKERSHNLFCKKFIMDNITFQMQNIMDFINENALFAFESSHIDSFVNCKTSMEKLSDYATDFSLNIFNDAGSLILKSKTESTISYLSNCLCHEYSTLSSIYKSTNGTAKPHIQKVLKMCHDYLSNLYTLEIENEKVSIMPLQVYDIMRIHKAKIKKPRISVVRDRLKQDSVNGCTNNFLFQNIKLIISHKKHIFSKIAIKENNDIFINIKTKEDAIISAIALGENTLNMVACSY